MDERRDTGWEESILQPAEELHMERDPREVVERYARPLPGRRSVPGSLVWVPASAGLLLCQHVVTELIKD